MSYPLEKLLSHIEILSGYAFKSKDFCDAGVPVIKIKNITPPYVTLEDLSFVSKEIAQAQSKFQLKYGDVLLALTGSHINQMASVVGRVARVKYHVPSLLNQRVGKIIAIDPDDIDIDYVYYFLSQNEIKIKLASKAGGAANQANISPSDVKNLEIPFPDIALQRRIASVLLAYDNLIENNQKQIELLEDATQRLYKEWFVDLRFPGYEDTPVEDGIPDGWKKCSILDNDIFIFAKSKVAPFEGQKEYYATADVTGTQISGDGEWITFQNKPSRAAIQPLNESVWFARMSNSYKILCCYGDSSYLSETAIISSGFAGFTACKDCYGFVYATIASKGFDEEKNRYATGATQVSLTNEGLKKIQVVLPTKDVAEEYSRIVEPYIEKAEQLKRSIKLLRQARDRLLPKLMSGEVKV